MASCEACHGTNARGTVLSRSHADRTLSTSFGSKTFWRGYGRGTAELGTDGCVLRVGTVLATTPLLALVGGSTTHPIGVPVWFGAVDATVQGFCLSTAAPRGFVAAPGLGIRFR